MSPYPAVTLAASLALASGALAQVPPGQFLATTGGQRGAPGLAFVEPLNGGVVRLGMPSAVAVQAAVLGRGPAELIVAASPPAATVDRLFLGQLNGSALTALTPYAQGFGGRITGMVRAAGGQVYACTEHTLFVVPAAGGQARPLLNPLTSLGCRDVVLDGGSLFVLAHPGPNRPVSIWHYDLVTGAARQHQLSLVAASAMARAPRQNGFLVGDPAGDLHLVDAVRYGVALVARGGRGPIRSLAYNEDQRGHLFGTVNAAQTLSGGTVGPRIPLPGAGEILHLAYRPYESTFSAYGRGCRGSNGVPGIGSVGRPFPGNQSYALTLSRSASIAPVTLLLGRRRARIDLGFIGMTGCTMLLVPELFLPAVATNTGRVTIPVPVPPEPALVGSSVYGQWAVLDRGANARSLVTSDGGESRL